MQLNPITETKKKQTIRHMNQIRTVGHLCTIIY